MKNAFSQIDVQLKRRYDLIPNLVETAKGYLKHERETLEAVIAARNEAVRLEKTVAADPSNAEAMKSFMNAESHLRNSMGQLRVSVEAYPELKSNTTMNQLMEELTSTENKISFARQAFNDSVLAYNNTREVFPNSILAGAFNFQPGTSFEIQNPIEKENVKVSFN